MDVLVGIVTALAWPVVVVGTLCAFRKELRALVGRIRKGGGLEFDAPAQSDSVSRERLVGQAVGVLQSAGGDAARPSATNSIPFRSEASAALEKLIREFPALKAAMEPAQREETLVAMLGRLTLTMSFLQSELLIWGSQIALLAYLARRVDGDALGTVEQFFYKPAAERFPERFNDYPFGSYVQFLMSYDFVVVDGDRITITPTGREYLSWRAAVNRPVNLPG